MKILLLHNHYSVNGGEDIVFFNELNLLKNQLGEENVFEYTVGVNDKTKAEILKSIFFSIKQYKIVYDLIKIHQIDIVHIHNYFPILTISVFKAVKDAGAKLVHTAHNYRLWCIAGNFYQTGKGICTLCTQKGGLMSGITNKCYRNSLMQSIAAQMTFWYYRRMNILNYVDKLFVLTNFQKEKLVQLGVDVNKILLKPNLVLPQELPTKKIEKKGYLYVGRLDESKGVELLLETWLKLPKHFNLIICGSGILEDYLIKKYNQSSIIFLGEQSSIQVTELMKMARYTIQPSLLFETFGLTIIESMSIGTPVIGFEIGTRTELIQHMKTGFLTSTNKLMETLLISDQFNEYDLMSQNAQLYAQKFLPDVILKQQLQIYNELILNR